MGYAIENGNFDDFILGRPYSPMLKLIWAEIPPKRAQFGIQLWHIGSRVGPKLELSGTPVPGRTWRGTEPFWEESSCLGPPGNGRSVPQPDLWPAAENKTLPKPAWAQTLGFGAGYSCPGWQSLPKSACAQTLGVRRGLPLSSWAKNPSATADFKTKKCSFYRGQCQIRTLGPFGAGLAFLVASGNFLGASGNLLGAFWELSGSFWRLAGNIENF